MIFSAKVLPDASHNFMRISLVELPVTQTSGNEVEPPPQEAKPLSAKLSKDREREAKTPEPEEDEANKKRFKVLSLLEYVLSVCS